MWTVPSEIHLALFKWTVNNATWINSHGTVHFSCKTNTQMQEQGENTGEKHGEKTEKKKEKNKKREQEKKSRTRSERE